METILWMAALTECSLVCKLNMYDIMVYLNWELKDDFHTTKTKRMLVGYTAEKYNYL